MTSDRSRQIQGSGRKLFAREAKESRGESITRLNRLAARHFFQEPIAEPGRDGPGEYEEIRFPGDDQFPFSSVRRRDDFLC